MNLAPDQENGLLTTWPAEWEPHQATWVCWPHSEHDWPDKVDAARGAYVEMIRHLAPGEQVVVLVPDSTLQQQAETLLADAAVHLEQVQVWVCPTDSSWTRDYGPMLAIDSETGHPVILDFGFTAWAKYPDFANDDSVASAASRLIGAPCRIPTHRGQRVILEGGAFDGNGAGALLTTEECLLHPMDQVRNPSYTQADYEQVFRQYLGATQVIWLGQGIAGDDTHGHVDDICRFVSPSQVVLAQESRESDVNYAPLRDNAERLQDVTLASGARLDVVPLPMPGPVSFRGLRLPASYANFYIANEVVLVPTYNDVNDRRALGILADLFPDREVVGLHATDLVWGQGSIHCLTQQQPRAPAP